MQYGEHQLNGYWYYFDTGTGAMQTGFVNLGPVSYTHLLPILFFLLHVSYGIGSLVGFLKLPFWEYKCK